jgi:hypothetical protein
MQGQKARSWRFKIGTSQLRETTLTENIGPPVWPGVGRGADKPTLEKTLVTKSEEAIAGYSSWHKLLSKVRAHVGLSSQWRWCYSSSSNNMWNNSRYLLSHSNFLSVLQLLTQFEHDLSSEVTWSFSLKHITSCSPVSERRQTWNLNSCSFKAVSDKLLCIVASTVFGSWPWWKSPICGSQNEGRKMKKTRERNMF